jgi:hypothetical protein
LIILHEELQSFFKESPSATLFSPAYSFPKRASVLRGLYQFWLRRFQKQQTKSNESELLFKNVMALKGDIFRALEGRCTQRIQLGKHVYFVKQHNGVGWKEIIKNLLQLRLPVISATNEWRALQQLQMLKLNVPYIVGYGSRGWNPAYKQSFLITRELPRHISLEDFCCTWTTQRPVFKIKRQIIEKVANIARTLHENGINHRDFYICHFLLDLAVLNGDSLAASYHSSSIASSEVMVKEGVNKNLAINTASQIKLYLIDLHRAQIRSHTPMRWKIKDLAGLYFSSKESALTKKDLLRFIKKYRNKRLHDVFNEESQFWLKVKKRGDKLCRKHAK